jgi:hypothetical protein
MVSIRIRIRRDAADNVEFQTAHLDVLLMSRIRHALIVP